MDSPGTSLHPTDIPEIDLQRALAAAPRPDLLQELVDISRQAFGFYTRHYPHTINYPWIAGKLEGLPHGSRLLDIAAGLNPVPFFLARRGMFVDCVDRHASVRIPPAQPDWSEWGFFDYGALHPNLTAHHCDMADFVPRAKFDAIYSISSLAHFPAQARQQTLRFCREWLHPGGLLVLAIDVIPSTDFIWNRSEGLEVEPPIRHGTVDGVLDELTHLDFRITECRVERTVHKSRTDLLFIVCESAVT
jgi:hypothetical protein